MMRETVQHIGRIMATVFGLGLFVYCFYELLQVARGVFEPRQIDGLDGSQHRTMLLR